MKKFIVPLMVATTMCSSMYYAQAAESVSESISTDTTTTVETPVEQPQGEPESDSEESYNDTDYDSMSTIKPQEDAPYETSSSSDTKPYPTYRTVNQGDVFFTEGFGIMCTIGFVENGFAYTASHCGLKTGTKVYDAYSRLLGVVYESPEWDKNPSWNKNYTWSAIKNDFAVIQLIDGVTAGKNIYSGDTVYTPVVGDKICTYGVKKNFKSCGTVTDITTEGIVRSNVTIISGDSGGPAWVPGKGFVGYTNFTNGVSSQDEQGRNVHNGGILIHRDDHYGITIPDDHKPLENHYGGVFEQAYNMIYKFYKIAGASESGAQFLAGSGVAIASPLLLIIEIISLMMQPTLPGNQLWDGFLASARNNALYSKEK